jgi:ubiquinone/menaquinone biosynthesis C-methylase UbiE
MREVVGKYDEVAERYSATDYADPEGYYARRAQLVVEHGPRLDAGMRVLDVACGDGGLGRHLLRLGLDYHGIDASAQMVEVAKRSLGDRVRVGTFDDLGREQVDAVCIFRSLYLVEDRRAFLAQARRSARTKLVFDFDPRAVDARALVADVRAAGFTRVELRPFLRPQRSRLPRAIQVVLDLLEPIPGSRVLTRIRFPLLVSASG